MRGEGRFLGLVPKPSQPDPGYVQLISQLVASSVHAMLELLLNCGFMILQAVEESACQCRRPREMKV